MSFIGRLVLLGVGRMVAGGKLTSGCCIVLMVNDVILW